MVPTSGTSASTVTDCAIDIPANQNDPSNAVTYPPSTCLLAESHKLCLELFTAALKGDTKEAMSSIATDHKRLKEAITENNDTVLHVAAGAKQTVFVEDMIHFMTKHNCLTTLKLQNKTGNTPFCLAVMAGSMPIAEAMLKADRSLLTIRGYKKMTPLFLAAMYGQKDLAQYLYKKMNKDYREDMIQDKKSIFFISIDTALYDLALKLLEHHHDDDNKLAMEDYQIQGNGTAQTPLHRSAQTPLHRLAQTPLHLLGQTSKSDKTALLDQALRLIERLWEKILNKKGLKVSKYIEEHKYLLFDAARLGNYRFLEKLISLYPDLVLKRDEDNRTIFHIAIMHRHDKLFKLIYNIGFNKQVIANYTDRYGNTLLHLAGTYTERSSVTKVPGAALEMQRELRIYEDVELLVEPSLRVSRNEEGETPRELFTRTHAILVEKGEKWMRDTASQCMLVGTIIATVVFSAAFSVPGGNDDKEGIPIHWKSSTFQIFAIADQIALFLSCISIIMFLSILTSRYAENDFYRSLPFKLVGGLLSLSASIVAMMIAFISSFFLAYNQQRSNAIPYFGPVLALVTVVAFFRSQYGLLRDVLYSSYSFRLSASSE